MPDPPRASRGSSSETSGRFRPQGFSTEAGRLRRLFSYTRPYRGLLMLSWLATAGYAAASAGLAHMIEPIFDKVLISHVDVASVGLTIVALYALKGLCAYLSTTMVAAAGQRAVTDLRLSLIHI